MNKRVTLFLAIFLVGLCAGSGFLAGYLWRASAGGVVILVRNEAPHPLTKVVAWHGGDCRVGDVPAFEEGWCRVETPSESSVLRFHFELKGDSKAQSFDSYITPGLFSVATVTVGDGGTVGCKRDLLK